MLRGYNFLTRAVGRMFSASRPGCFFPVCLKISALRNLALGILLGTSCHRQYITCSCVYCLSRATAHPVHSVFTSCYGSEWVRVLDFSPLYYAFDGSFPNIESWFSGRCKMAGSLNSLPELVLRNHECKEVYVYLMGGVRPVLLAQVYLYGLADIVWHLSVH
jgi:hypothetical protein